MRFAIECVWLTLRTHHAGCTVIWFFCESLWLGSWPRPRHRTRGICSFLPIIPIVFWPLPCAGPWEEEFSLSGVLGSLEWMPCIRLARSLLSRLLWGVERVALWSSFEDEDEEEKRCEMAERRNDEGMLSWMRIRVCFLQAERMDVMRWDEVNRSAKNSQWGTPWNSSHLPCSRGVDYCITSSGAGIRAGGKAMIPYDAPNLIYRVLFFSF